MQRSEPEKNIETWAKRKKWGLLHKAAESNYSLSYGPYVRVKHSGTPQHQSVWTCNLNFPSLLPSLFRSKKNMLCGCVVQNMSEYPNLPGCNKDNYNREKETGSVLNKDQWSVRDWYWSPVERGWTRVKHTKVSFTSVFMCLSRLHHSPQGGKENQRAGKMCSRICHLARHGLTL